MPSADHSSMIANTRSKYGAGSSAARQNSTPPMIALRREQSAMGWLSMMRLVEKQAAKEPVPVGGARLQHTCACARKLLLLRLKRGVLPH